MKATLHLGLHKTGTTYVQAIYRQLSGLTNAAYVGPDTPSFQNLKGQLLRARNGASVGRVTINESVKSFCAELSAKRSLYLSDETLIGATPLSEGIAEIRTLYPTLERQGELITQAFNRFDATIVITVRNPISFIYSLYRDGLKYGKYGLTFDEFLQRIEVRSFHPEALLRRLKSCVGFPVKIIRVEDVLTPHKLQSYGLIDGADLEEVSIRDPLTANASSTLSVATIQRLFAGYDRSAKTELRKWLASCPVKLRDDNLAFTEVAISQSARAFIEKELATDLIIPRKVHLAWIGEGSDPGNISMPAEVSKQIDLWCRNVPDFEVKCWTWGEACSLFHGELGRRIITAIEACRLAAMRADILRLGLILWNGGVWSDIKNRPQQNFLGMALAGESLVLCEHPPIPSREDQTDHICNGFFAATPDHHFIREVLELALRSVETRQVGSVYSLTGGGLFNRVAKAQALKGESSGRLLPYREAWRTWMRRVSMRYNDAALHWSQRQKVEPLYFDTDKSG